MSIVLVGYRGSGKTTIGRKLADRLWQDFHDSDQLIVHQAGRSIREIFATDGEAAFRALETQAVRDLCRLGDAVIALGGGAVLAEENRRIIRESRHKVIYLRCDAQELARRIEADPNTRENRPNLTQSGGLTEIQQLLAVREPLYRQVMTAELDVSNMTIDEAVVRVVKVL